MVVSVMWRHSSVQRWFPPVRGGFKLNVDVACHLNQSEIGLGDMIRHDGGKVVVAQALFRLGCLNVEAGEISTLLAGLLLAHNLVCVDLWVESNIEIVVKNLHSTNFPSSPYAEIYVEALALGSSWKLRTFSLVPRGCNIMVYNLAHQSCCVKYSDLHEWLSQIVGL